MDDGSRTQCDSLHIRDKRIYGLSQVPQFLVLIRLPAIFHSSKQVRRVLTDLICTRTPEVMDPAGFGAHSQSSLATWPGKNAHHVKLLPVHQPIALILNRIPLHHKIHR